MCFVVKSLVVLVHFVQILLCFYVSPFVFKIPKIIFLEEKEELLVRLRTVVLLL